MFPGAVAVAFLAVPVLGLVGQAPWGDLWSLLTSSSTLIALRLSLLTSIAATAICLVLGIPLALLMARTRSFGSPVVRALVTLPLVLPPVVGGVALLAAFLAAVAPDDPATIVYTSERSGEFTEADRKKVESLVTRMESEMRAAAKEKA